RKRERPVRNVDKSRPTPPRRRKARSCTGAPPRVETDRRRGSGRLPQRGQIDSYLPHLCRTTEDRRLSIYYAGTSSGGRLVWGRWLLRSRGHTGLDRGG